MPKKPACGCFQLDTEAYNRLRVAVGCEGRQSHSSQNGVIVRPVIISAMVARDHFMSGGIASTDDDVKL